MAAPPTSVQSGLLGPLAPPPAGFAATTASTTTASTTGPTSVQAALLGSFAPPTASSAATTTAAVTTSPPEKTLQQLMNEIDVARKEIEQDVKQLEKIDVGKKKAAANRDQSVEGRKRIQQMHARVTHLQQQMNAMTKASDPSASDRAYQKTKANGSKTLSNLTDKLNHADRRLEKISGPMPATTVPPVDAPSAIATAQPAAVPTTTTGGENTRGLGALMKKLPIVGKSKSASKESLNTTPPAPTKPADQVADTTPKTTKHPPASDGELESGEDDDDDDVITESAAEEEQSPRSPRKTEPVASERKKPPVTRPVDSGTSEDDDDSSVADNQKLLSELRSTALPDEKTKDLSATDRQSRTPPLPASARKAPILKTDTTSSSSPRAKRTTTKAPTPPPPRKKMPSPVRRAEVPADKKKQPESDEDSYFEEDEDEEEEEELRRLGRTAEHEEIDSDRDYDEPEDESTIANAYVQQLRTTKYPPGSQFLVTHDFAGVQTGDLTVRRGEELSLIEQRSDDWWLFKNPQTQQEGVVPINSIQYIPGQRSRRRAKPSTSATTLVDAFKASNSIPSGFVTSDLGSLSQLEEYTLWYTLVPKMSESNLAFADLHWRADSDRLHVQEVTYQKVLIIKECVKIPRIKGDQIRVLDRCVRVCLYDGLEIVSNIHTIRAHVPAKIDDRDLTEDWHFLPNNINTLIDEQSQLLIRANRSDSNQQLKLLIELSQWCQSTVTQEKCEIACGWSTIPLEDHKPPFITDTKGYNELLHGGHIDETNVLLTPQYNTFRSNGLSGMISRLRRARVKFSLESREDDLDLLYDSLPVQSQIVPINAINTFVCFRNELAYQLHKRHHPTGLSTTPFDSIFLSTFFDTLKQPDLIYTWRRLYRSRKKRFLTASATLQQQRNEFVKTYELFIYPLLQFRTLPPYDFHDIATLNERRKIINDMVKRQLPKRKVAAQDILTILLDPALTEKWTPFTTDETCFTFQKYIHNFTDVVA